jgi:uncharacterized protein (TIGR03437 family)
VASFPFQVAAAAPGIFTDASGALVPAGSGVSGSELSLFITGAGDITPFIPTGYTPSSATRVADLPKPLLPVAVSVGGMPATVSFAGVTNGLVGTAQINFIVPNNVAAGPQPVVVTVGGVASPSATVTVTQ